MLKLIKYLCGKCGYIHYTNLLTDEIVDIKNLKKEDYIIISTQEIEMWNCCI